MANGEGGENGRGPRSRAAAPPVRLRALAPALPGVARGKPPGAIPGRSPAPTGTRSREPAPLVHLPIHAPPGATHGLRTYLLELVLTCLDSYYAHENDHELLVTTNDREVAEGLARFRGNAGQRFEIELVGAAELAGAFGVDTRLLGDEPCARMLFPKFYPIFKRRAERVLHLDLDTLFVSKVDFGALFAGAGDVALLDANGFKGKRRWFPSPLQQTFFRMYPLPMTPTWNWINSGVFVVQDQGFELCREEVSYYLAHLDQANRFKINIYPDEILMNALAIREHARVRLIRDYTHNFLAYHLRHVPDWRRSARVLHFHSIKPHAFGFEGGSVQHAPDPEGRMSYDLYLAVLLWCRQFHAACRKLGSDLPMTRRMPLGVVESELQRVSAALNARRHVI